MSYHIEDVLKSVRDAPPPPAHTTTDTIIKRARRTRTRRNFAVGGGVVACLAVAATVLPQLGPGASGGVSTAARPTTPTASFSPPPATPIDPALPVKKVDFRTNLGEYRVGAYQIGPATTVTEGYSELPVYHDGLTWQDEDGKKYPLTVATITVYDKDVYDPSTFGGAGDGTLSIGEQYSVTVGGRTAIGRDWTYGAHLDAAERKTVAGLAWQYADESWATFLPGGGPSLSRDQVATIAAGLKTTDERGLTVPYRAGFVPKGWQAVSVMQAKAELGDSVSAVYLHEGPLADPATRVDAVLPGHLIIRVGRTPKPGKADYSTEPGVHCFPDRESCSVVKGDYLISLEGYGGGLSVDEIRQIAEGLQLRDPADQSTWAEVNF